MSLTFTDEQLRYWRQLNQDYTQRVNRARRRFAEQNPRYGDRWSVAEDRKLRRLVRSMKQRPSESQYRRWHRIGKELGRTSCAVMGRWYILRVVDAHAKAAGLRGRRHATR